MLLQMAGSSSFSWLNNVPLYTHTTFPLSRDVIIGSDRDVISGVIRMLLSAIYLKRWKNFKRKCLNIFLVEINLAFDGTLHRSVGVETLFQRLPILNERCSCHSDLWDTPQRAREDSLYDTLRIQMDFSLKPQAQGFSVTFSESDGAWECGHRPVAFLNSKTSSLIHVLRVCNMW